MQYMCLLAFVSSILNRTSSLLTDDSPWPNAYPKQLVAVRRRPGLTQAEYLYHHTIVHAQKAWNAPDSIDQPIAYVQDHAFDSAYGINTSSDVSESSYFGHQDITELYSRSEDAFRTPPPNNYTATVIGPDGAAFNDFAGTIGMFAYERFVNVPADCECASHSQADAAAHAFYFAFADASRMQLNDSFATAVMTHLLGSMPMGALYNASIHVPVPELDTRPYYGGYGNPVVNAVLKFWLCDDNSSVLNFREGQKNLLNVYQELGLDLENSFVMFTRPVLIYDRYRGVGFDLARAQQALRADQVRGDAIS